MSRYDSIFGASLLFLVIGMLWLFAFLIFAPACAHYEAPPPIEPSEEEWRVFPDVGDSIAVRHVRTHVWYSSACCDVLERRGEMLRLGPPCDSWLQEDGMWRIVDCMTGRSEIR